MNLDKKLKETEYLKKESWGKIISIIKKQFDQWVLEELASHNHHDFKLGHLPFIMNIASEGISNNELAKRARVTKQAMSKVAKELQELGYIVSQTDPKDGRVIIFSLTDRGKKFVIDARVCVKGLMDEYRGAIGKNKFDSMIQTLLEVIAYNEKKSGRTIDSAQAS
jgi:DNA-binding MarR family transcriptional regulator